MTSLLSYIGEFGLTILVGVLILSMITWVIWLIHWVLRTLKVYEMVSRLRLRWKFSKGFQYEEDKMLFCAMVIKRKWKYRDIKKITKNNPEQDKILHTYNIMRRLTSNEIEDILKGGGYNEEGISRFEGKVVEDVTKFANKREH